MYEQSKARSIYFPQRISEAMNGIFDYPLTIVEAPMGYGKTTAVREHISNGHATILWQKIHDHSTNGFWNEFCNLIGEIDVDCSLSLAQLGFPNDSVSLQESVKLIESIGLPEKTIFVIDDYHLLNGAEVGSFIHFIVMNEIEHLHIVLTTRFIEYLSIEELSLKGYLYHITKETFEFLPNEIIKYYKQCDIILKKTEADALYSHTEGWISALYLMMLNYKEEGSFMAADNIYKLVLHAIFKPASEEIKDFLLNMCIFDSFTKKQAIHMWGNENAEFFLAEITTKNAFINYDFTSKTYQIHTIFTNLLQEIMENKDSAYKKNIYEKAGQWYKGTGENLTAMHYFYVAEDFENLLQLVELDRASSFGNEQKDLIINYFENCPKENKQNHLVALLVYAMALVTFNEMELFEKVCSEFVELLESSNLAPDYMKSLMGELELVLSFTSYNDILGMSEHHKKACEFLKKPSAFMDTTGSWTFGSPSVLYMFYRESGKLEQAVQEIKEAMPYYYQLTKGHGMGAEHVMAAEWYFNKGHFEDAEIEVHKAFYLARSWFQPNIIMCALFLQIRLTLLKGDYANVLLLLTQLQEEIEQSKQYNLMHSIDMCIGFVNACLQQTNKIPEWLAEGDFSSDRLFFPAKAFYNMIYGRVLLIRGEYSKLLGISKQFIGIASVFPNLLANIYTTIYMAAANEKIYRRDEAIQNMKQALDMAMPDMLYMPFVENCDYIKPVLEALSLHGIYREDIARILDLYAPYEEAISSVKKGFLTEDKPKLTEREKEIAQLAAEGFSNKKIGEILFISENTIKKHLKGVFEKLGVGSRSLLKQYFTINN